MLANIKMIKVKKNQKIYDLNGTFNIIVQGRLQCLTTQQRYKRFDVLSDAPMQVNQLDYSKPLKVLSHQQQVDALSGLEVRGI